MEPLPDPFLLHFLSFVGPVAGLRVLDAGCGRGRNAVYLAASGARVVALDRARLMVREGAAAARAAGTAVDPTAASALDMPFRTASFDVVVCTSVLESMVEEEAWGVAGELRRVLAPDGRALVVAAAAEGSEGDPAGNPPFQARLTSRAQLDAWFAGFHIDALLHLKLVEPATAAVRAQWALMGRAPG